MHVTRFTSKYLEVPSGCWEWQAYKNAQGYGKFGIDRKVKLAHRVSYELKHGELSDTICVLHKCDNPSCVNPDHLFLGTRGDNIRDCISKGRGDRVSGENHYKAKLSTEDVRLIRQSSKTGVELAKIFGVTHQTIYLIKQNKIWKKL